MNDCKHCESRGGREEFCKIAPPRSDVVPHDYCVLWLDRVRQTNRDPRVAIRCTQWAPK